VRQVLAAIATRTPDARLRLLIELRVLSALGIGPELRHCVRCGGDLDGAAAIGFHVAEGGPLCARCAAASPGEALLPIHLGTLRALEQGLHLPLDRLDRLALGAQARREAEAVLGRFQRFHAGVELRSERFLASILSTAAA
jgi:DNA repair protein RecO (recombination protein O)